MATPAPPTTRWKPWCAPPRPPSDGKRVITEELLSSALQRKFLLYDKSGEEHYNLISALHKSVRNSDADATLYWLARMLESGEDPLYVARRLVRMASEDIGLADPAALGIAVAAMQAADFIGVPEGNLALAQAAVYLALAPKSNALYTGYGAGAAGSAEDRVRARSAAPAQRRHRLDEARRLRPRLSVRARRSRKKSRTWTCLPPSLAGRDITSPPTRDSSSACASAWKRSAPSNPAARPASATTSATTSPTTTHSKRYSRCAQNATQRSPQQAAVLFQNASVHDDEKAGVAGAARRRFVGHAFLHPDLRERPRESPRPRSRRQIRIGEKCPRYRSFRGTSSSRA